MTPLSRLILYWLIDGLGLGHPVPLRAILPSSRSRPEDRADLEWKCAVLEIMPPSDDDVLREVESLIEAGRVSVVSSGGQLIRERTSGALARASELDEILVAAVAGSDVSEWVREQMSSEHSRKTARELFRAAIVEAAASGLTFVPRLPDYLPRDFSPKPDILVDGAINSIVVTYYSEQPAYVGPGIILEESTEELGKRWPGGQMRDAIWDGAKTEEVEIVPNWKVLVCAWAWDSLNIRASFAWSAPSVPAVEISDAMRIDCVRVLQSLRA